MDQFRQMAVFAAVAAAGSMSAAARQLGMTPSAVSQTITSIERGAGVRLLNRSTRKLALTDIGERYLQSCQRFLAAARDAQNDLNSASANPTGLLRISAPLGLGAYVSEIFGDWLAEHPDLRLWLDHGDSYTDLIDGKIDLAIRFGALPDSTWYARRIGTLCQWLVASPEWCARHPSISDPRQIPPDAWIVQTSSQDGPRPLISSGDDSFALPSTGRFTTNSQTTCHRLCLAGHGVAILTDLDTAPHRAEGSLTRILDKWQGADLPVWAMSSHRQTQPAKVSQAIERLRSYFAEA